MSGRCRGRDGATVCLLADLVERPGHGDGEEEAGGGGHSVHCPRSRHGAQHAEDNLAQSDDEALKLWMMFIYLNIKDCQKAIIFIILFL